MAPPVVCRLRLYRRRRIAIALLGHLHLTGTRARFAMVGAIVAMMADRFEITPNCTTIVNPVLIAKISHCR
jgi:hypothetical protein